MSLYNNYTDLILEVYQVAKLMSRCSTMMQISRLDQTKNLSLVLDVMSIW